MKVKSDKGSLGADSTAASSEPSPGDAKLCFGEFDDIEMLSDSIERMQELPSPLPQCFVTTAMAKLQMSNLLSKRIEWRSCGERVAVTKDEEGNARGLCGQGRRAKKIIEEAGL